MDTKEQKILEEEFFKSEGLTLDERDFYLRLLTLCKDIKNPENVENVASGSLVEMVLRKKGNEITFNGSVEYPLLDDSKECRCIDGTIFISKDKIVVDSHVTRLEVKTDKKEYTVLDEFPVKDGVILSRSSYYNYEMPKRYNDNMNFDLGGLKR